MDRPEDDGSHTRNKSGWSYNNGFCLKLGVVLSSSALELDLVFLGSSLFSALIQSFVRDPLSRCETQDGDPAFLNRNEAVFLVCFRIQEQGLMIGNDCWLVGVELAERNRFSAASTNEGG